MRITLFFHYLRASIYKSPAYKLLIILLIFAACAPAVDRQDHKETHKIEAISINGCVKGVTANPIANKQDLTYCIESTEQSLGNSERRELNNYLNSVSNSELQILSAKILARQAPVEASNKQAVVNALVQEVTQLSSNNVNDSDYDEDEDSEDEDSHDHDDHDHDH